MRKIAVHFGAGALGRGLVVPILRKNNYEVVIVDIDQELINKLNKDESYKLIISDSNNKVEKVNIIGALSSNKDKKILGKYLEEASIISTSVRRENLDKVANTLLNLIKIPSEKTILCAENIEAVSSLFQSELRKFKENEVHEKVIDNFSIPNTMVDRICASDWPNSTNILTEEYFEFTLEQKEIKENSLTYFNFVENIEASFVKKRLLVNTFADASSFFALAKGEKYLYQGIKDEEVQRTISPYINLFIELLTQKYDFDIEELIIYKELCEKRLGNNRIKRDLETVARNIWAKLTLEERFVWPLTESIKEEIDPTEGIKVLLEMIKLNVKEEEQILKMKLKKIWTLNKEGKKVYDIALKYM